ncbi:MAG: hypothetical protein COA47_01565 [Robiginitomaculum sp.]|nr:MAG: hypothetical protein COA47_01565 [Robiginitomaculum sp.]
MRTFEKLEAALEHPVHRGAPKDAATFLLHVGEEALENWIEAKELEPTDQVREGFRILALHRQGAKGDPSFNACRETARELVYHYNLICLDPDHPQTNHRLEMMQLVAKHLVFFIGGKLQVAGLGEFCCAAKPIRLESI